MSGERPPAAISSSSSPSSPSYSSSWRSHHCDELFFSSLRGVEDRLASENSRGRRAPDTRASSPPQQQKCSSGESSPPPSPSPSYSAPLFVDHHGGRQAQPHLGSFGVAADPLLPDSSDPPPLELFSESILRESPPSSPLKGSCLCPAQDDAAGDVEDDVVRLVELLGLSEIHQEGRGGGGPGERAGSLSGFGGDQGSGGFLSKIAGLKGPKCRREIERLDGWIRYYRSRPPTGDGGAAKAKKEPARLGHLLLAMAVCDGTGGDGSDYFGGIEFPATVEEYLQHDPPDYSSLPS